jgi:pSer/pThr/pTyr-binding forkhead associated (FHA) protein
MPVSNPPAAVRKSPLALVVMSGADQGKAFDLYADQDVIIGTSKKAGIVISDTVASRRHVSVRYSAGRLHLTDLQSTNGTFVNGSRVETKIVGEGDQILVGLTVFQVVEASQAVARSVPPSKPLNRRFRLHVLSGPDQGTVHDVVQDRPNILGSSKRADITIEDDVMSRRHLQLTATPFGLLVEDLGSTNGTFVNAQRITKPVTLLADHRILIGKTILQVVEY